MVCTLLSHGPKMCPPSTNTLRIRGFLEEDLLYPSAAHQANKHKLKRLIPTPNSYFMDVKCPGCYKISVVFSHAKTVVLCGSCSTVLCQPTGGKANLTEGCKFKKKAD
ncbi:ribosomal protein S27 [Acrasis kona]|uniref:40S ribosomal protein S27 n=1 Tax=Acrasis kona TaxID=1008807 RepID=A0AAW2ZI66_9EUKA